MAEFKATNSVPLECTLNFNYLYYFELFMLFQFYRILYIYTILLDVGIETDNTVSLR